VITETPIRSREVHNSAIDECFVRAGLCGTIHLPSGRICALPALHRGGCSFELPERPSITRTDAGTLLGGRLFVTARARAALRRMCRDVGPQELIVSWPGGINHLPARMHQSGPCEVVIAHVARCPIYADLRQLALFRDHHAVVDVPDITRAPRQPVFRMIVSPPGTLPPHPPH